MHRFTHIDGEIRQIDVRLCCPEPEASVRVVLSLYPWWEHPRYLAARADGAAWGFTYGDEAKRELVIEAVRPLACRLSTWRSASDLDFTRDHPELWQFEDEVSLFCNAAIDHAALFDAVLRRNIAGMSPSLLASYLPLRAFHPAPFCLGTFPYTLLYIIKDELERMGVPTFIPRSPSPRPVPVLMTIDDSAAIIAEDFVLEVPDFEHRPEWFTPAPRRVPDA